MAALRKTGYFLLFLLIIAGGLEFLLYSYLSKARTPPKKPATVNPTDLLLNANEVRFESEDGVDLHGWLILGKAGYPALILAHDYGSGRADLLGKLEGLITKLNKEGYFIFVFDFRGHGESGSKSTFGFYEPRDLEAALKAVLKYKQITPRIGVLGVGMGAIAAPEAFRSVDEVKFLMLDTIYEDIPSKYSEDLLAEWQFLVFSKPALTKAVDLNFRQVFRFTGSGRKMTSLMPELYPKAILFVEKIPLRKSAKDLYEAAREPKELLQMDETAAGELIGDDRGKYSTQLVEKIHKYLPAISHEKTLELSK